MILKIDFESIVQLSIWGKWMWVWKLFMYITSLAPLLLWVLTISGCLLWAGAIATVSLWAWRSKRTIQLWSSLKRVCLPSYGWSSQKTAGCIPCHCCQATWVRKAAGNHWNAERPHPTFFQLYGRERRSLGWVWVVGDLQRWMSLPCASRRQRSS